MKFAKTIAIGATALGLAAGSALANDGFGMSEGETFILLDPIVAYYDIYAVDENRDGVIDGYLFLEQSDTLG